MDTFPDAIVIHLHRDPCQAIPSVCSLAAAARAPFCESIDYDALGEFWLNYYAAGLERGLKARHKSGPNQIIDIRYPDLKEAPLSVIDQIQNIISLDDYDTWAKSLKINTQETRSKQPGDHRYNLSQFGLDADQIGERFAGYIQDYNLSVEVVH